ncbi:hypothetical protein BWD42_07835 [Sphingobacterium sp. CZ-UAM]|uniref:hypothetical protein n=1 Tax=Sphingobacterium sp. CZ-UAM TaxID=1933868 RepID=UPI0009873373|nr:hypothetical protein [Sphingobacterium sp. CZ-UAM]OOG19798.1 hypothetical protein BWD42_07835 [Sphingobacterium sp. CZ-UAM]
MKHSELTIDQSFLEKGLTAKAKDLILLYESGDTKSLELFSETLSFGDQINIQSYLSDYYQNISPDTFMYFDIIRTFRFDKLIITVNEF